MLLSREGFICGPSSGMALQALLHVLQKAKDESRLSEFAGADGKVHAVFTCCDLPYQYMDNYARKLGPTAFAPIGNAVS
jgi:cysteine synthase